MTSKLTRMSFSLIQKVISEWMKSSEFLTLYRELPRHDPSGVAADFPSLYAGTPVVLVMGLGGSHALWILGIPYNLNGL